MTMETHDYTKRFICPDCGERLHGVKDWHNKPPAVAANPTRVVWVCQKAIGELAWDPQWRRHYFPPGSIHRGRLLWYVEDVSGLENRWQCGPLRPLYNYEVA